MQVGTPEKPIQNKITITMYGNKDSPSLPHYGNKVIALREGILDIHGKPVSHTWSRVYQTANANTNQIILTDKVDWKIGDSIVIASTDYDHNQSEERQITAITNDGTRSTITLDQPLKFKHHAGIQTFEGKQFEMPAEVGLLSRTVVI